MAAVLTCLAAVTTVLLASPTAHARLPEIGGEVPVVYTLEMTAVDAETGAVTVYEPEDLVSPTAVVDGALGVRECRPGAVYYLTAVLRGRSDSGAIVFKFHHDLDFKLVDCTTKVLQLRQDAYFTDRAPGYRVESVSQESRGHGTAELTAVARGTVAYSCVVASVCAMRSFPSITFTISATGARKKTVG